jgi:tetratricopeptide (TPR) repeat protein/predicted Ser/Thr protein kinase
MIGRTIGGHYRILERIGAGGMGVVYRARDERLERDVAIKVLPDTAITDDAARRRIRHEALALSRAAHPHIATVHDVGVDGDVHFIVMEYIPGENLSDRLAAGPLAEREVIRLGRELTSGLDAAHRSGVIHRDLKPGNLRLTPDGHLKILDFGIAGRSMAGDAVTRFDPQPGGLGTLPYMAPEQARGAEGDARSDIYAVGAVLYEMSTGRRAHPGRRDAEVLDAVLHRMPQPPRELAAGLSVPLEACIVKALDKDPERRYQTARELLVDLTRVADPNAVAITPTPAWGAPPRVSRSWALAAFAAVIAAVVGLLLQGGPPVTALPPRGDGSARLRVAVLPAHLRGEQAARDWSTLVQSLLADQFTGIADVGVIDSLSLNSLLGATADAPPALEASLQRLRAANVALVVESQVTPVAGGFELRSNVLDAAAGERLYASRARFEDEAALARGVAAVAENIVVFLQVQVLKLGRDEALRPWVSYRNQNIQAVKAFLQASDYIFRYQPGGAERLLRRAIELDPSYIAPRVWLISGLHARGERNAAAEQYRQLVALEPGASPFEQAMIGLSGALLRNDVGESIRHLEVALKYSPGNHILLINFGGLLAAKGDCPRALSALDPLVDAKIPYAPIYPLWGYCAVIEGRSAQAIPVLEAALKMGGSSASLHALLEAALIVVNRPQDADQYGRLRTGSHGEARLALLYERLADRALQAGEFGPARRLLELAVEQFPRDARRLEKLADAILQSGDIAAAEKAYHDALAVDPRSARAELGLGEIAERRNDVKSAVEHYRRVLANKGAGESESARARERLDQIGRRNTNR